MGVHINVYSCPTTSYKVSQHICRIDSEALWGANVMSEIELYSHTVVKTLEVLHLLPVADNPSASPIELPFVLFSGIFSVSLCTLCTCDLAIPLGWALTPKSFMELQNPRTCIMHITLYTPLFGDLNPKCYELT